MIYAADLFCGAGGTSTGLLEAAQESGQSMKLTAINHWPRAVETHSANHPDARHLCASLDSLDPRSLFLEDQLDLLWASPECTHHSIARGGKPINDQSRATAWCVVRWAEALRPRVILIENVKEFLSWGPIGTSGKPIARKKGDIFRSWVKALESCGYRVEWRILCAADYGDPTIRRRLFIYCVRGRRRIIWPEPTHAQGEQKDLFTNRRPWNAIRAGIDWEHKGASIFTRKRPLKPKTIDQIKAGLEAYNGQEFIICMEHKGTLRSVDEPLPTITTARGGAMALVQPRPFLIKYYNTGTPQSIDQPLDTVTTRDRFALVQPQAHGDILLRMLKPSELAFAQGFPRDYKFTGTTAEVVKQIGNAVPKNLAKALAKSAIATL